MNTNRMYKEINKFLDIVENKEYPVIDYIERFLNNVCKPSLEIYNSQFDDEDLIEEESVPLDMALHLLRQSNLADVQKDSILDYVDLLYDIEDLPHIDKVRIKWFERSHLVKREGNLKYDIVVPVIVLEILSKRESVITELRVPVFEEDDMLLLEKEIDALLKEVRSRGRGEICEICKERYGT